MTKSWRGLSWTRSAPTWFGQPRISFPSPRHGQRAQVLVIFALTLIVILTIAGLALDGGYAMVQVRRAQSAADFAALAGARQLLGSTTCSGPSPSPNMAQVVAIIQGVIDANSSDVGTSWQGRFLDANGHAIVGGNFDASNGNAGSSPPAGSCGLNLSVSPSWRGFLSGIVGVPRLTGSASATVTLSGKSTPISVIALNKVEPHTVHGLNSGTFIMNGDIQLNSDVPSQRWTESVNGWEYDDVIDMYRAKMYVYGTLHSVDTIDGSLWNGEKLWPLDACFGSGSNGMPNVNGNVSYAGGTNPPPPTNQVSCDRSGILANIAYNHIDPSFTAINDPLQNPGAPPNPWNSTNACPGMSRQTFSSVPSSPATLQPGEYTLPVHITTSMTFGDCSAFIGEPAAPGIYQFDQGLWIDPQHSGDQVTGKNVMLVTKTPYGRPGNVPGSGSGSGFVTSGPGNGGPCLPQGTPEVDGSAASACGGTSNFGVMLYGYPSAQAAAWQQLPGRYGTGANFSLTVSGASGATVSLDGPTTGAYAGVGTTGIVMYQDPGTPANYGFDSESGAAATITLNGTVYNASLPNYGSDHSPTFPFWDIMLNEGGTLQTGSVWMQPSGGSVTINGTVVVDQFVTVGNSAIIIQGQPYLLPGSDNGLKLTG